MDRSAKREVRNPLLSLPAMRRLQSMPDRGPLVALFREVQADARLRADKSWRTHKGPMALYWKAVGVYAGHLARALAAAQSDEAQP